MAKKDVHTQQIPCGQENSVIIFAKVLAWKCADCGLMYVDSDGESMQQKAIDDYLLRKTI